MKSIEDFALLEDLFGRIDLMQYFVGVPLKHFQFRSFLRFQPLLFLIHGLLLHFGFQHGFQKVGVLHFSSKGIEVRAAGIDSEDNR